MAANTAYADFPRLAALQAADGYLPRQLTYRGSRLVYSRGIAVLALVASILIWFFDASVTGLIPLYAIGVFLSFTLSQAGMAHRWWKSGKLKAGEQAQERGSVVHHDRRWLVKMVVNGFGAALTGVVTLVFAATKFRDGAWVVLVVIPALVAVFYAIHFHYRDLARRLSLEKFGPPPRVDRHRVILPISGVHRGVVAGLTYARALSDDVTAVYVSADPGQTEVIQRKWGLWGGGVRLVVVDSPLPAAGRAARRVHPAAGGAAAAERGDHGRRPAVRAASGSWHNAAARADRDDAEAGPGVRAGGRHHQRALPGRREWEGGIW